LKKLYDLEYLCCNDRNLNLDQLDNNKSRYLITIPIRLGIDKIDSKYYDNILYITGCKSFIGIIGGHNNKSFYFIGSDKHRLIYLDPHITQSYQDYNLNIQGFSSNKINYLEIDKLSPTLSLCFLVDNMEKLDEIKNINKYLPNKENTLFDIDRNDTINENIIINDNISEDDWNMVDT
jgi:hypothetical protein